MFARQIVRALVPAAQQTTQRRALNVVSGPPLTRVSLGEKAALGFLMVGCWLFVPAWVLVNIKNYKGKE